MRRSSARPSSTKNAKKARDPEMHQTKKGNQWYFGMKAHIGIDSRTKLIHAAVATPANVADSTVSHLQRGRGSTASESWSRPPRHTSSLKPDATRTRQARLSRVPQPGSGWVGDGAAMPVFARELLVAHLDAIIAFGGPAIRAAREATKRVPIVIFFGPDPVESGWAASLAHPGGNVTGVVNLTAELDGKQLDLLHGAVPAAQRLAVLLAPPSKAS
jgi:hypothetical protein